MRHYKWEQVIRFLDDIIETLGPIIKDKRCGKSWDVGQAVCAEAYGPNWMENETFNNWNCKDDNEPPEPHYFNCARSMSNGYIPEWVDK